MSRPTLVPTISPLPPVIAATATAAALKIRESVAQLTRCNHLCKEGGRSLRQVRQTDITTAAPSLAGNGSGITPALRRNHARQTGSRGAKSRAALKNEF